jgi:hypothetical protein
MQKRPLAQISHLTLHKKLLQKYPKGEMSLVSRWGTAGATVRSCGRVATLSNGRPPFPLLLCERVDRAKRSAPEVTCKSRGDLVFFQNKKGSRVDEQGAGDQEVTRRYFRVRGCP